jgi:hypothetical protein
VQIELTKFLRLGAYASRLAACAGEGGELRMSAGGGALTSGVRAGVSGGFALQHAPRLIPGTEFTVTKDELIDAPVIEVESSPSRSTGMWRTR